MYCKVRLSGLVSYRPVTSLRSRSVTGHWPMRARPGGLTLNDMRCTAASRYPQQARTAWRPVRPAVVLGEVHIGAGAILAQGLVVRAHGAA
jgi:hypothetical protein